MSGNHTSKISRFPIDKLTNLIIHERFYTVLNEKKISVSKRMRDLKKNNRTFSDQYLRTVVHRFSFVTTAKGPLPRFIGCEAQQSESRILTGYSKRSRVKR
ncbi:hypothetical protein RRG08_016520 [Elysia crispata]|uniref:Uncharacterized protein n=1 Tax=Elysia crispata TaxID=231223 RepID=A0AAE1E348_9GAST|nr:hypothetical protein RRG08_016520 [Elysia crispata]